MAEFKSVFEVPAKSTIVQLDLSVSRNLSTASDFEDLFQQLRGSLRCLGWVVDHVNFNIIGRDSSPGN